MLTFGAGWHMHLDILVARATGKAPDPFWDGWTRLLRNTTGDAGLTELTGCKLRPIQWGGARLHQMDPASDADGKGRWNPPALNDLDVPFVTRTREVGPNKAGAKGSATTYRIVA